MFQAILCLSYNVQPLPCDCESGRQAARQPSPGTTDGHGSLRGRQLEVHGVDPEQEERRLPAQRASNQIIQLSFRRVPVVH